MNRRCGPEMITAKPRTACFACSRRSWKFFRIKRNWRIFPSPLMISRNIFLVELEKVIAKSSSDITELDNYAMAGWSPAVPISSALTEKLFLLRRYPGTDSPELFPSMNVFADLEGL